MAIQYMLDEDELAYTLVREDPRSLIQLFLAIQKELNSKMEFKQGFVKEITEQIYSSDEAQDLIDCLQRLEEIVSQAEV